MRSSRGTRSHDLPALRYSTRALFASRRSPRRTFFLLKTTSTKVHATTLVLRIPVLHTEDRVSKNKKNTFSFLRLVFFLFANQHQPNQLVSWRTVVLVVQKESGVFITSTMASPPPWSCSCAGKRLSCPPAKVRCPAFCCGYGWTPLSCWCLAAARCLNWQARPLLWVGKTTHIVRTDKHETTKQRR